MHNFPYLYYTKHNGDDSPKKTPQLIGFYIRDRVCLLRGTIWIFKYS